MTRLGTLRVEHRPFLSLRSLLCEMLRLLETKSTSNAYAVSVLCLTVCFPFITVVVAVAAVVNVFVVGAAMFLLFQTDSPFLCYGFVGEPTVSCSVSRMSW